MKDLTDPRWIKFKGVLFFIVGALAAALLVLENPTIKTGSCSPSRLVFCRAYDFALLRD